MFFHSRPKLTGNNSLRFNLLKMIGLIIVILFALSFPCEGQINLPPGGDQLVVAPSDDAIIAWTFNNTESQVDFRSWSFTSSSPGSKPESIGSISRNNDPEIKKNISLPRVEIKTSATLILRNVDHSYDGTYEFTIVGGGDTASSTSGVRLFVAKNSTMTTSWPSVVPVNEGENVTCPCKAKGENPPVNMKVTWYKDGAQIGPTRDEENMLSLINVNGTRNGTYICKAKGEYNLTGESNSTEVKVRPNFAPYGISISPTKAFLGKSVNITCEATARPKPTYTIIRKDKVVSNGTTYTIAVVKASDRGSYKCIAKNILGKNSKTIVLEVVVGGSGGKDGGLGGGAIAGIIIGVLMLLLITLFVVWKCKYSKENESVGLPACDSGFKQS